MNKIINAKNAIMLFLMFILTFSIVLLAGCGDSKTQNEDVEDIYIFANGSILGLTAYGKEQTELTIPSEINGEPVTTIAEQAFSENEYATTITLSEGITTIEDRAFQACKNLLTVNLPQSITSIGEFAFFNSNKLRAINLSDNLTSIGAYAFYDCENLDNIVIPASITNLNKYLFAYCENLKNISLPNTLQSIDACVFMFCEALEEITLPINLKTLGSQCFRGCNLSSITIPASVEIFNGSSFIDCVNIREIIIESNIAFKNIKMEFFNYSTSFKVLKSIVDNPNNSNSELNSADYTRTEDGEYYIFTKVAQ